MQIVYCFCEPQNEDDGSNDDKQNAYKEPQFLGTSKRNPPHLPPAPTPSPHFITSPFLITTTITFPFPKTALVLVLVVIVASCPPPSSFLLPTSNKKTRRLHRLRHETPLLPATPLPPQKSA